MKRRHFLKYVAVFVLCAFAGTLLEASWNHFFHDVLPEDDVGYLARIREMPRETSFLPPIAFEQEEDCAFSRLLSFLNATSFLDPVSIHPAANCTEKNILFPSGVPESWPGYTRRARDPPAFFRGLIS